MPKREEERYLFAESSTRLSILSFHFFTSIMFSLPSMFWDYYHDVFLLSL